ncbi:MAG: hypothetical protein A3F14_01920 [Gammaproteobacteria bacterium RIFCSPHIGHO2_12_FULL_43_28]|nr:MAG: hypothetical protein A3F14_01920 [Gammaproteobacteria bacterium RIFCSPHIGHO2_12_FULL_43_28]
MRLAFFDKLKQPRYSWWVDCLFLIVTLSALFFIMLGSRPLFVPDEGRYAEIAREMLASHDFITPHLNNITYFEKPALFYWLTAATIKMGGLNLWSVRSVNGILGLLGCLLTYAATRKLYDRATGLLAAFILATSVLYFLMTHMVSLDLPVTVFIAACLYAFLIASKTTNDNKRRYYMWGAAAASALAVLTKGLIGLLLPGLVVFVFLTFTNEWRNLKAYFLPSSLLIFLIIALPWHLLVGSRNPEFYYFYFIEQHFLRYTTKEIGHYQPVWFFIPVLLVGFFPWIIFLPQALWQALNTSWQRRKERSKEYFLFFWAVLIFVFFSFSKSKLIPYILPVFPPLAILTARYLAHLLKASTHKGLRCAASIISLIALTALSAAYFYTQQEALPDNQAAQFYLVLASLSLFIGALLAAISASKNKAGSLTYLIASMACFLLLALAAFPGVDNRTVKPLANIVKARLQPGDDVITYNQYFQDLPFYLERPVTILNWQNELTFGMRHQNTQDWMIGNKTFWQRFLSKRRVYVVISKEEFEKLKKRHPVNYFYVGGETINTVLISNRRFNR